MTLTLSNLIIIALLAVVAWLGAKWAFKKDTEIENRRRAAGQLAAKLKEMGFTELPELFIDYSVGDYSGLGSKIKAVAQKMMSGEKAVLAEISDVFDKLLKIRLATIEGRMMVKSELESMEKLLAPAEPAAVAPVAVPEPAAPVVAPIDVEALVAKVAEVALTVPASQ
jgi:hypothetical protein